jgi:hypothetical protein
MKLFKGSRRGHMDAITFGVNGWSQATLRIAGLQVPHKSEQREAI